MSDRVRWESFGEHECLVVDFEGHLDRDGAIERLEAIEAELAARDGNIAMIWQATEMSGYDKDARSVWQERMAGFKDRLDAIHLVTESFVVRMGASVVSMFMRYPIKTWKSVDAIRF